LTTYGSSAGFRRALEDRLRAQSLQTAAPLIRLRKMVVFDRFLVRLIQDQPNSWVLKGGLALQLRLGNQARTTKDMDVLLIAPQIVYKAAHQALVQAAHLDVGDWFKFDVELPISRMTAGPFGGLRFHVTGLLDGRRYENFHIDVGWGDPLVEPAETLTTPALLAFAGIPPTLVPCYPLTQQIAEKVHAYTLPRAGGQSSRVKDLIDILLIAELGELNGETLYRALKATFKARQTHHLPVSVPDSPPAWGATFRRLARETSLQFRMPAEAVEAARCFLDPVLRQETTGIWDPVTWSWQPSSSSTAE